jgi:poly(A) polymerase
VSESGSRIEAALAGSEPVRRAREALAPNASSVWIVGGALRDALLGRAIVDVDLAVDGSAEQAAKALARATGGHAFALSNEFGTWRATAGEGGWTIDVAALRGATIEEDLHLRDFTVNAAAVPLDGGEPIDPTGGISDAEAGILRAASARSFSDDPLRILRAARIAAELGLRLQPETLKAARAAASDAARPSGERRFAELRGMLTGPDPLGALELLDQLAVTPVVLPQLDALRGVDQSANHHLDVYEHTTEVLRRWLGVEADLGRYAGSVADEVAARLEQPLADELTRSEGIRFAAILHDIGKPATRAEAGGFVSFRGHDAVGAEMVVELCRELRTSRRFAEFQAALTRNHLVLGFMVHERPLPRRRVWEYLERTGGEALDVTMLTIADRLSAQGSGVPEEAIQAHLDLAREMLAEIVAYEREGPPRPLLGGEEVAELLELEPGARIGEALRELAAAQFAGEVADRAAAEEHLRAWHQRTS